MTIDYVSPEYTSVKCGIRKKDSSKLGLTFATLWTIACQVPLSMHSPGKSTGVGLPFSSPGDLPDPGIKPGSKHCRQILYQLSYVGSEVCCCCC